MAVRTKRSGTDATERGVLAVSDIASEQEALKLLLAGHEVEPAGPERTHDQLYHLIGPNHAPERIPAPGAVEPLVVSHSVPHWCCHVTWAVGGGTVELWA